MSNSDSPDTNPDNLKWFLHGDGCFTHKGYAEQRFKGVVPLPKKLKPERELTIAKGITTTVQNSTAACSAYFKKTGDVLSRLFVHALKHTDDNLVYISSLTCLFFVTTRQI